jgi:hypothetical protein
MSSVPPSSRARSNLPNVVMIDLDLRSDVERGSHLSSDREDRSGDGEDGSSSEEAGGSDEKGSGQGKHGFSVVSV